MKGGISSIMLLCIIANLQSPMAYHFDGHHLGIIQGSPPDKETVLYTSFATILCIIILFHPFICVFVRCWPGNSYMTLSHWDHGDSNSLSKFDAKLENLNKISQYEYNSIGKMILI